MIADPAAFAPKHIGWRFDSGVATITLDRPARKNPLTFDSYAELRDTFRALAEVPAVKAVILTGAGGNFCSGGDVAAIIEPLTRMDAARILRFTRMTGDLVRAIRACPAPVVAAADGVAVGAGAALALAADLRLGTPGTRVIFPFTRLGLGACDMGACALLPRLIGQGRAADLLFTGRAMSGAEGAAWGFFTALHPPERLAAAAADLARGLAAGPGVALALTKTMLNREWGLDLDSVLDLDAQAQALAMLTEDFQAGYRAAAAKRPPDFTGR